MPENINANLIEMGFNVAEHTNTMLAYWDNNLICRFANNAHVSWIGVNPDDMINKMHIRQLLGPLHDELSGHIDAVLRGKVQVFEQSVTLPSGQIKTQGQHICQITLMVQ
jgi:hypothetical protein